MKGKIRYARRNVNAIFLVGEVIDKGFSPRGRHLGVRLRLKLRPMFENGSCMYVDVFGNNLVAKEMNLVGSVGSIVFMEGQLSNEHINSLTRRTYIKCNHIECLYRSKDVKVPTEKVLNLIDNLDPSAYVPEVDDIYEEQMEKEK